MKKMFILLLTVMLCCTLLSGCNFYQLPEIGENGGITDRNKPSNGKTPRVDIETPPDHYIYHFASYADIMRALSISSSSEYIKLRNEQASYGSVYFDMLKLFDSGDATLLVPKINGVPIEIRDAEGYSKVSLMTCELYNLPWIWYHCTLGEYNLCVRISYLNALESDEIGLAETYLDIIGLIAPDAPTPSNYQEYESYKKIYEKEIAVANGRVVTAMISEVNDSSNVYVMLLLNDCLVCMYADTELFSESFWSSFDLTAYDGI